MTQTRPAEEPAADESASKRARTDDAAIDGGRGTDVTEDEAALYDRQIRLWGLEAQNRMRKAHVLVHNIEGVATETIKNIVLSGIGSLTIVDAKNVAEEDLSSGFLYRENDVGKLRVEAAVPRIQALNPLVKINVLSDDTVLKDEGKLRAMALDTLVTTSGSKEDFIALNDICRSLSVKFYASESQGLGGWIFSDLGGPHSYVVERATFAESGPTKGQMQKKRIRFTQNFVPLRDALQSGWKGMKPRLVKRLKLSPGFFGTLAHWQNPSTSATELQTNALAIAKEKGVELEHMFQSRAGDTDTSPEADAESFFASFHTAVASGKVKGDFAPTSAIIGGLLAQDVLNTLGGREEPISNWLQLDGMSGHGTILNLNAGEPKGDA